MKDSILLKKSDEYAHATYKFSLALPKEEMYGITSQIRRASLSVPLNIIEGFARGRNKSNKQFLLIAYGSLKESKYLLNFIWKEGLIKGAEYKKLISLSEEIGKILWTQIERLKQKID